MVLPFDFNQKRIDHVNKAASLVDNLNAFFFILNRPFAAFAP